MQNLEECPLGGGNCDYTDNQVLSFVMGDIILREGEEMEDDECRNVFCPVFRYRLIRLVKEDERKKPVANLGRIRRMEKLREAFEDFTLY